MRILLLVLLLVLRKNPGARYNFSRKVEFAKWSFTDTSYLHAVFRPQCQGRMIGLFQLYIIVRAYGVQSAHCSISEFYRHCYLAPQVASLHSLLLLAASSISSHGESNFESCKRIRSKMEDVMHQKVYFEHTWQLNPPSFLIWRMDLIETFMGDKQTGRQADRHRQTDTQTHRQTAAKSAKSAKSDMQSMEMD